MWWYFVLLNCYSHLLILHKSDHTVLHGFCDYLMISNVIITFIDYLHVKITWIHLLVSCFTPLPASPLSSSSLHILKYSGFQGSECGPPYLSQCPFPNKLCDLPKLNHNFHNISQIVIFSCDFTFEF